jgi:hypothetical protein
VATDLALPPLYHWSPRERREAIRDEGLKPYRRSTTLADPAAEWAHGFGCVCLAPTPARAWALSGDMQHLSEIEAWDLWQVALADTDEVRVRAEFGPRIQEVRVFNPIPADRLWWVATRS